MKLHQDCSILVLSHERHDLLINNINYYQKFTNNIIVLDSSKKKIDVSKKVRYFHLPDTSIFKKIIYGLRCCKSNYVIISPDDDFFLTRSLNKGINFLKKNNDYISVGGLFFSFETFKKKIFFKKLYNNSYQSFDQKTVSERLKAIINIHPQLFYSLFKKKVLFESFRNCNKYKDKVIFYHEFVATLTPLLIGKHKHLNSTWMLRDGATHTSCITQDNLQSRKHFKKKPSYDFQELKFDKILFNSKNYLEFMRNIMTFNSKFKVFDKTKELKNLIDDYFKKQMVNNKKFQDYIKDRVTTNNKIFNLFKDLKSHLGFLKYFKYLFLQINKYYAFSEQEVNDIKIIEKSILDR